MGSLRRPTWGTPTGAEEFSARIKRGNAGIKADLRVCRLFYPVPFKGGGFIEKNFRIGAILEQKSQFEYLSCSLGM